MTPPAVASATGTPGAKKLVSKLKEAYPGWELGCKDVRPLPSPPSALVAGRSPVRHYMYTCILADRRAPGPPVLPHPSLSR